MGYRTDQNQWAMGEYFAASGGLGETLAAEGTTTDDESWKKPWFFGLFVGALVGYSFAHLTKK
jgi:hypothetical protein